MNDRTPRREGEPEPGRQGILGMHGADDTSTRQHVEEVLAVHATRWALESDDRGADGLPTLTYKIRLKKHSRPGDLLQELRARPGPRLAKYTRHEWERCRLG